MNKEEIADNEHHMLCWNIAKFIIKKYPKIMDEFFQKEILSWKNE